jgi:adenylate cyclase
MFIDLRGSTKIATRQLPYDALFLFDRYVQVISDAILERDGYVTSVAGDGIMSVFVAGSNPSDAARAALHAGLAAWQGLQALNIEIIDDIGTPLQIGIGLHYGLAIVGRISMASQHLQFLGDTGNTAAKLQDRSKQLKCTMVVSTDTFRQALLPTDGLKPVVIEIDGRPSVEAICFRECRELDALIRDY